MYSIGEVSKMFDLPVSTLRYYDKEGLFPNMQRVSGIRKFSDNEIEAIRVIECLKKSGLEIKEIKQFGVLKVLQLMKSVKLFLKREERLSKKRCSSSKRPLICWHLNAGIMIRLCRMVMKTILML